MSGTMLGTEDEKKMGKTDTCSQVESGLSGSRCGVIRMTLLYKFRGYS